MRLSEQEIMEQMQEMPEWHRAGAALRRSYTTVHFRSAVSLVVEIAMLAETADHHPDLTISYNRVDVTLTTHSAGGVTQKDFDLANAIESIAAKHTDDGAGA